MIHIFFVPGMFGSAIEHVLRNFTEEMVPTNASISDDGSMHTYYKMHHPFNGEMIDQKYLREINTPIYPFDDMHLPEILKLYGGNYDDRYILLYANSFLEAEKNILFQYYKIAVRRSTQGISIFYGNPNNAKHDVSKWNKSYTSYKDLKPWEFREWFSIFYPGWISEWQDSVHQVPDSWLKVPVGNVLTDTEKTFNTIIEFSNLTKRGELSEFIDPWLNAQQYILKEFEMLDKIVYSILSNQTLSWNPISIVGESIIQQRLRAHGYEIQCDGLNIFPTNSQTLRNLLEKV